MFERPSDLLDYAAEVTQREIDAQLAAHKARTSESRLRFKGICHNCDEELDEGLFCDSYCLDDYEWRTKKRS